MKSIAFLMLLIAALGLLAYTNPTLDIYQQYLQQSILKQAKRKANPVERALGTVLGGVASGVIASQTVRTDYVFWSTYETRLTDRERLRAIGVLNNFYVLENPFAAGNG